MATEIFDNLPTFPGIDVSRRTTLKAAIALVTGSALGVLDRLANFSPASATVGSEHTSCAGYDNWSGYDNNQSLCVGGTYGGSYCGSDGWFKSITGPNFKYYPTAICGEGSYGKRNAWRWKSGYTYRCADGYFQSPLGATPVFRICAAYLF
jgi:hypothetical protein